MTRTVTRRWRKPAGIAVAASAVFALAATAAFGRPSAGTPIRIAVMSDCQGAFGSFDNQDLAGVVTAMSQFAGGHPKNPNKPRDGWVGASINGHPLELVGVGCGNDTGRQGDLGDEASHGAAERRHHDRPALG